MYKVRVIDVKPIDETGSTENATTLLPDVAEVANAKKDDGIDVPTTINTLNTPKDVESIETLDEKVNEKGSSEEIDLSHENEISKDIDNDDKRNEVKKDGVSSRI